MFNILVSVLATCLLVCVGVSTELTIPAEDRVRFTASSSIGVDQRVEPAPRVRVYAYNPPGTFNPSGELYNQRWLRSSENSAYRSEALQLKNRYFRLLQAQRRQLGRIIDAREKGV